MGLFVYCSFSSCILFWMGLLVLLVLICFGWFMWVLLLWFTCLLRVSINLIVDFGLVDLLVTRFDFGWFEFTTILLFYLLIVGWNVLFTLFVFCLFAVVCLICFVMIVVDVCLFG